MSEAADLSGSGSVHVGSFPRSAGGRWHLPLAIFRARPLRIQPVRPWQGAAVGAAVAAAALVTDLRWAWPWHLQLLAPLLAGAAGWWLARFRGGDPATVVWGLLLLFSGASAAQRLGVDAFWMVPLASAGLLVGILVTRPGPPIADGAP